MTVPKRTQKLAVAALHTILERYIGRSATAEEALAAAQVLASWVEPLETAQEGDFEPRMGFVQEHVCGSHNPYAVPGGDEDYEEGE